MWKFKIIDKTRKKGRIISSPARDSRWLDLFLNELVFLDGPNRKNRNAGLALYLAIAP